MKRLRVILLFLLLGAVINVAVAWGCALCIDLWTVKRTTYRCEVSGKSAWEVNSFEAFGSTRISSDQYWDTTFFSRGFRNSERPVTDLLPNWGNLEKYWSYFSDAMADHYGFHDIVIEARGWPLRTLWCEHRASLQEIQGAVHSLPTSGRGIAYPPISAWKESGRPRVLPFLPIWRGLAFNSSFYAVLLWILISGPFVLRRFIRCQRGLCENCAYDLRGNDHAACPECGAGLPG